MMQNSLCCKNFKIETNMSWSISDFHLRQITFIYLLWFSDLLTKGPMHVLKYSYNFKKLKVFSYATCRAIVFADATSMLIWSSVVETQSHKKYAISYPSITALLFSWYLIITEPARLISSNDLYSLQAFCLLKLSSLFIIINDLSINYQSNFLSNHFLSNIS